MKDSIGQDLKVGDTVAYQMPNQNRLETAIVTKLTPTGATIDRSKSVGYRKSPLFRQANQLIKMVDLDTSNKEASEAFSNIVNFLTDDEIEEMKPSIEIVSAYLN